MTPVEAFIILRCLYHPNQRWSVDEHNKFQTAIKTLNNFFSEKTNGESKNAKLTEHLKKGE